ncbi:putative membrane protein [Maridesulfovibrio ferrireducens]|uniref:Putative membrane protein n=1 Tax=Maridesulfovibrio ferrireducens TaxID=246191 RepID=A0A1G9CUH7_9BACT|nr:DUF202 domain-containing protein [Maridesulfovibrio ferrireducens]SDK55330.1 putative membrane protein [Maridesulfovibrio ferrireducens]
MTDEKKPLPLDTNSLAVMRTLLANERTFLAWCRTALGLLGFGFVLEKAGLYLKHFVPDANPLMSQDLGMLSLFALFSGMLVLVGAAVRFFSIEKQIGSKLGRMTPFPEVLVLFAVALVLIISVFSGKVIFN